MKIFKLHSSNERRKLLWKQKQTKQNNDLKKFKDSITFTNYCLPFNIFMDFFLGDSKWIASLKTGLRFCTHMSMKQSSYNHISAPFPKQWRPRSTHWPHRHPSKHIWESGHREPISTEYSTTVFTALRHSCSKIVSTHLNSFTSGIVHKQEKCSVSKASDQAGVCTCCCSGWNSSLSTHLWGCWSADLLARRCLQPKEQGLKWGEELSYQQLSQ